MNFQANTENLTFVNHKLQNDVDRTIWSLKHSMPPLEFSFLDFEILLPMIFSRVLLESLPRSRLLLVVVGTLVKTAEEVLLLRGKVP